MRQEAIPKNSASPLLPAAVGCFCVNIAVAIWALLERPSLNSDFRGIWSFAAFAHSKMAARIYQAPALQAFQQHIYPEFRSFFPFQYPPSFLLAIRPLGDFSYAAAQSLWTATGLAALISAGWIFFAPKLRWFAIMALLASPTALLNGAAGETGFFTAAILLAGFAWLPSNPLLAGSAFGLLTIKPQLGLLIPFALLARGETCAMLTACLTALILTALSTRAFPARLWVDWLHAIPVYQAQYSAAAKNLGLNADITVIANLRRLGVAAGAAWSGQALVSLFGAAGVFLAFRHGPYRLAVAALFAGSCICAPHACAYDGIPLIAAILLLAPQSAALSVLCLIVYLAPYLLLTPISGWFVYAIPETLLFTVIIYLAMVTKRTPDIRHEPISSAKFDPKQR